MEKKVTSHVVKGVIIALILIVLSIIAYLTDQQNSSWNKWLGNILLFGGVVASCIVYANQLNNYVSFGNVFAHGFKVCAVVTCIVIVFTVVFLLVSPDVKAQALETARQQMLKNNTPEETIQKALSFTQNYFYALTIGIILFFYLLIGVFASLVGAAFANKKEVNPLQQTNFGQPE